MCGKVMVDKGGGKDVLTHLACLLTNWVILLCCIYMTCSCAGVKCESPKHDDYLKKKKKVK